jgi:molybdopterin synthase catalytic subunit
MSIRVQTADFDAGAELARLGQGRHGVGGVACFIGRVRDANDGNNVVGLELEHYPGMTEAEIQRIVETAHQRWGLLDSTVIHRVGQLAPGDQIVFVATASAHRAAAFAACEFIMDYLKTRAPFWKKETSPAGTHWVDARDSDEHAAARWHTIDNPGT